MSNNLRRNILTVISAILLTSCGFGTLLKKGDESFSRGEYNDAANYYRRAYAKVKPKKREMRGEIAWKMANCYRYINFASRARGAYINAMSYDTYLALDADNGMAAVGRESCDLLPQWRENPTRYVVRKDKLFNGRRADYSPEECRHLHGNCR